jgi:hypothetical protein
VVKRVIVGVLAILLIIGAVIAGATAIWAHGVFGSAGVLRFDAGTIVPTPGASATVIDIERFGATVPYLGSFGTTTLSASSAERGDPADTLFIGAADTEAVDAYLKGSTYSVALREGSSWLVRPVPGVSATPLPRDQGFWLAQDVGRPASIVVPDVRPLTVVIMHPAGVPSGPLVLSIDFSVPDASTWIAWLAAITAILLVAGVVLLLIALRRRPARGRHVAGAVTAVEPTVAVAPTVASGTTSGDDDPR